MSPPINLEAEDIPPRWPVSVVTKNGGGDKAPSAHGSCCSYRLDILFHLTDGHERRPPGFIGTRHSFQRYSRPQVRSSRDDRPCVKPLYTTWAVT